jgi:hypothetical protein
VATGIFKISIVYAGDKNTFLSVKKYPSDIEDKA